MIKKELLLASWLEKLQKKWDNEEYYYDVEEATKVFKFVSKLTNDRGASRQFELLEFQFEIITEILCVKRRSDGKRKHREAHINIPRKNGKSFLAAIIVVYLFFCQRHIFGALFILTANTTKQAGELYATVEHFIKTNKTLRRYCKITSSSAIAKQYGRNGEIEALYPCTVEGITVDDAGLLKSKLRHKALVDYRIVGSSFTDSGFYEDLLIFKGFTMDGINTKPIREIVKGTIEGQIKAQNYLNTLYDNGLTNKLVVQLTSDIKDEKELRKTQEKFGRLYSKGKRIFTVPAGFSVQPINLSLADAQYEQIRRMSISQIAALFGIKMHQLNDLKDTNNNSLEQQQLSFLIDTLLILFESIEQETTWSALTKEKRDKGYKARFNTNVILRTSAETQQKILCAYVSNGIYTPNEARLELQRQKLPDGDELIVNAGVLKLKDIGKKEEGSGSNANE